mgnify:CR=1 FL=1
MILDEHNAGMKPAPPDDDDRWDGRDTPAWMADNGRAFMTSNEIEPEPTVNGERPAGRVEWFTFADLRDQYPNLKPPVVDGLFRAGETANLISSSKVGKSWLAYSLALSINNGRFWLGKFKTTRGKVLLIDNELHRETLAYRIPKVAAAMNIEPADYENDLEIIPLRGNLRSIHEMAEVFCRIEPGTFKAIIIDAKYRMIGEASSENDNAAETHFYNRVDSYADQTGAAIVMVHHSSKGSQSDKRTTDVGAGAGAQSRAADCHLVLREHEENGVVVLDAAVRSFAPVEPVGLRWQFPLWKPANDIDPTKLKGRLTQGEQNQRERDTEGKRKILDVLVKESATARVLRGKTGLSRGVLDRLLDGLEASGDITWESVKKRGNECREYSLCKSND